MKNLIKNELFKIRHNYGLLKWMFIMPPFIIGICVFYYLEDNELTVDKLELCDVWNAVSQNGYDFILLYFALVLAALIGRSYKNKTIHYEIFYGYSYLQSACSRIMVNGMAVFLSFFIWYLIILFAILAFGGNQQLAIFSKIVFLIMILFHLICRLSMIDIIVCNQIWGCALGIVIEYVITSMFSSSTMPWSIGKQMMILSHEISYADMFVMIFSFVLTIALSFAYMFYINKRSNKHFVRRK